MPQPPLRARSTQFLMPKDGAGLDECEDAVGACEESGRFAVADGATEAFDAGSWARRLAEGWVRAESAPLTVEAFGAWAASEGARLHEGWEGKRLPWYAEEKARAGSFAAFVGVELEAEGGELRWRSVALGDACLLHLRGGEIRAALPVTSHRDFNSGPVLVPSRESLQESALGRAVTREGRAAEGDTLLLMSDAAAAWFFRLSEARDPCVPKFDSLLAASENESLAEFFRNERRALRLKDDDVAVVRIAIEREMMNAE